MSVPDFSAITQAAADHASATGLFATVNRAECKSAPNVSRPSLAIWVDKFGPDQRMSGLPVTALQLTLMARVYSDALTEPMGEIDPDMLKAVGAYMEALTGDYTLGGRIREVDLLGRMGTPMGGKAGYLALGQSIFRVFDITIPCALNEEWSQSG